MYIINKNKSASEEITRRCERRKRHIYIQYWHNMIYFFRQNNFLNAEVSNARLRFFCQLMSSYIMRTDTKRHIVQQQPAASVVLYLGVIHMCVIFSPLPLCACDSRPPRTQCARKYRMMSHRRRWRHRFSPASQPSSISI